MKIENENDITADAMLRLRMDKGLSQTKFWAPVCVSAARGSCYETRRNSIPKPIKRLLFLYYVLRLPIDSPEIADLTKTVEMNQVREELTAGIDSLKKLGR